MKKITPDPPVSPLDAADSNNPLLDRAAIERALNYYLQGHKPHRPMGTACSPSRTVSIQKRLWPKRQTCYAVRAPARMRRGMA